jgi:protein-S-isoprenylcysteine O-methyltransferase
MTDRTQDEIRQRISTNGDTSSTPPAIHARLGMAPQEDGGFFSNTPLTVATIAFVLGSVFCLGSQFFLWGGLLKSQWAPYQLGFYAASWGAFHYGEFAVTAGWNRPKCSVDCEILCLIPVHYI